MEDNLVIALPAKIEVPHCKVCGKIRVKGKWLEQTGQNIKAIVEANLKLKQVSEPTVSVELKPLGDGTSIGFVSVAGKIAGEKVSLNAEALIIPKETVCNSCALLGANYFEAILQLRFKEKASGQMVQKALQEIERLASVLHKADSLARITGVEKAHNGLNIELGSKRAAKKIVEFFEKKHNAKIKSSFSLAGVNASGKERKRYTFLIRI